ncbi:MAG: glycosyltransferase family 39 protein [Candidatus Omnitrophota bacterium]|nr:glycosyltransferase family 39 protein [Candidatus Omnitrophota bacterium]
MNLSAKPRPYALAFIAVAGLLAVAMPLLSLDFGITWDDWAQSYYGRLVLRFFLSGGADREVMGFKDLYLYGGFFDVVATVIYGAVFDSIHAVAQLQLQDDLAVAWIFETRHCINALFGFLAILFAGLAARHLAGWRAGFFAMIFLAISPRFLGHAMNNPKDIPFAMGYMLFLYLLIKFTDQFPRPRISTSVGLAVAIAVTLGVRIGGVLLLAYLWVFGLWSCYKYRREVSWPRCFVVLGAVTTGGYFGGLLFWPYGLVSPLIHPWLAMQKMAHFTNAGDTLLFEGRKILASEIPWYYIPKWIAISSPILILLGLILLGAVLIHMFKHLKPTSLTVLLVGSVFPVVWIIVQKSQLYNGWRHVLFIYPPLVVLIAAAWDRLFEILKTRNLKIALCVFLGILCLEPVAWMMRNHPYQATYFNALVGDVKGAVGYYETDYWGNSLRACSECLADHYRESGMTRPIAVHADGSMMSSFYYLKRELGNRFIPYKPAIRRGLNVPLDYYIMLPSRWEPSVLQRGGWPPASGFCEARAGGAALCTVFKSPPSGMANPLSPD